MQKISVITVSYNAEDVIEKTILSIINQTYKNYEYIIVDGNSTDGTIDIIKKYESKITYWESSPDNGIYDAMNKAVFKSSGDYCIFMNAGDYFYNKTVLSNIFSQDYIEDILSGIAQTIIRKWYPPKNNNLTLFYLIVNGFCHQATFIKRELLLKRPYDTNYKIISDSKFFIETIIQDNASYLELSEIICFYDNTGISSNRLRHRQEFNKMLSNVIPQRIYLDYKLLSKYNNPLFKMLLPIVDSTLFGKIFLFLSSLKRKSLKIINHIKYENTI